MVKMYLDDDLIGTVTEQAYNVIYKALEIYAVSIGSVLSESYIELNDAMQ
jgi:hypothetical protein